MSATLKKRLDLCIAAYKIFLPEYVVVTGGMANTTAGVTEAQVMYTYLVRNGIPSSKIIKEDKSLSTQQNAIYTLRLLEDVDFNHLVIVSTIEHFINYGAFSYFNSALLNNLTVYNKKITIMAYTNNASI